MARRPPDPPVYSITGARRSLSDDVRTREIRYVLSMSVRTLCLILAIIVPYWPVRALLLVGAVILPYIAVVIANGGRSDGGSQPEAPTRGQLAQRDNQSITR